MAANSPAKESSLPYPVLITVKSDEEEEREEDPCLKSPSKEATMSSQHGVHIHVVRENHGMGLTNVGIGGSERKDNGLELVSNTGHTPSASLVNLMSGGISTQPPLPAPSKIDVPMLSSNDRCTPSQAQTMGKQVLAFIEASRKDPNFKLPIELQSSFDIVHRCLGVIYGTFFLNMYFKANAPCLLCHSCHGVYPPSQFIHHPCPGIQRLDIPPCKSRMWRRCLIPLVSQNMDKLQQKQRWKYVLEKFSHAQTGINRRSVSVMGPVLDMPELKRGRFVASPGREEDEAQGTLPNPLSTEGDSQSGGDRVVHLLDTDDMEDGDSDEINEDSNHSPVELGVPPSVVPSTDWTNTGQYQSNSVVSTTVLSAPLTQPPPAPAPAPLTSVPVIPSPVTITTVTEPKNVPDLSLAPSTALGLAENLLHAVRRLESELASAQAKLKVAEQQLKELPSESAMRVQLSEALATQQKLRIDRDVALQRCKLADERSNRLESQLRDLKILHSQFGAKLSNI